MKTVPKELENTKAGKILNSLPPEVLNDIHNLWDSKEGMSLGGVRAVFKKHLNKK